MIWLVVLGATGLVLSYVWVGRIRVWAERHRMLDIPNERSSHTVPVARGGGLAIVAVSLTGLVLSWYWISTWSRPVLTYVIGAILVFTVSWLDDLRPLSNRVRFAVHAASAILVVTCCGRLDAITVPFLGRIDLGMAGFLVAFLWIVGLTNAYNFMDGIDGIAGGQAVVGGVGWAILGWMLNIPLVSALGALLATTSLGFLFHNWPPARIFMGDAGSAFLGYSFACLAIISLEKNSTMALAGVLIVWPFVFDTTFTFFRRLINRENVFAAHRSHLYQRLVISGLSHQTVTLLYAGLDILGVLLALLVVLRKPWADLIVVTALLVTSFGLWGFTVMRENLSQAASMRDKVTN